MDLIVTFFRDILDGTTYVVVCSISAVLLCACIGYLAEKKILKKEAEQGTNNTQLNVNNNPLPTNNVVPTQNLNVNNVANATPTQTLPTDTVQAVPVVATPVNSVNNAVQNTQPVQAVPVTETPASSPTIPTVQATPVAMPVQQTAPEEILTQSEVSPTTTTEVSSPVQNDAIVSIPSIDTSETSGSMDMPQMPQPAQPQSMTNSVMSQSIDTLGDLEPDDSLLDDTILDNPTTTSMAQPQVAVEQNVAPTSDEIIQTPSIPQTVESNIQ